MAKLNKRLTLRLSEELKKQLEEKAEAERRSVNFIALECLEIGLKNYPRRSKKG